MKRAMNRYTFDPASCIVLRSPLPLPRMPYVDHARREIRCKVVYYGPGLGGKTTNLEFIHRCSRPEHRGKLIALNTATERTLFFDLLPMKLGTYRGYSIRLHLCTVPGQLAHEQTRRLVLRHVDGVVFVVDSQAQRMSANIASLRNLQESLRLQGSDPEGLPSVVQYNKRDLPTAMPVDLLAEELAVPPHMPQQEAIATRGFGVFETLKAIAKACLAVVEDPSRVPSGRFPSIIPRFGSTAVPEVLAPTAQRRAPPPRDPTALGLIGRQIAAFKG